MWPQRTGQVRVKVLIAEDDKIWRRILEKNVTSWGYEAVLAEDGKQAWEILQREDAPRLAIIDWQMPGMDGFQLAQHIRADETLSDCMLVMASSGANADDADKCERLGSICNLAQ